MLVPALAHEVSAPDIPSSQETPAIAQKARDHGEFPGRKFHLSREVRGIFSKAPELPGSPWCFVLLGYRMPVCVRHSQGPWTVGFWRKEVG